MVLNDEVFDSVADHGVNPIDTCHAEAVPVPAPS
jgi:hypothetical protein